MLINKIEALYPTLSKSQQHIARFIQANYGQTLFCSLAELAGKIGTSTASIVRFSHALGYSGFSDMQKNFQSHVMSSPAVKIDIPSLRDDDQAHLSLESVANMFSALDSDLLFRIANSVIDAKNILIIGYLDSFGIAAELLHQLDRIRENVYLSRLMGDWNEILGIMTPGTLVIAVSISPHYTYTFDCARTAKSRGCAVLTISDMPLSPFTAISDLMLNIDLNRRPGTNLADITPITAYIYRLMNYMHVNFRRRFRRAPTEIDVYIES